MLLKRRNDPVKSCHLIGGRQVWPPSYSGVVKKVKASAMFLSNGSEMIWVHCLLSWQHTRHALPVLCALTPCLCDYFCLVDPSPRSFYVSVGDTGEDPGIEGLKDRIVSIQYLSYISLLTAKMHLDSRCGFDTLKKIFCFLFLLPFFFSFLFFLLWKEWLYKSHIFLFVIHSIVTSDMYLSTYALNIK